MKKSHLIFLLAFLPAFAQGQTLDWLRPLDLGIPSNGIFTNMALAVDDQGHAAVIGPTANMDQNNPGLGDLEWHVFAADGQSLDSTVFFVKAGASDMVAYGGSFFIVGAYADSLHFPGQALLSTAGQPGSIGHFICRMELDGTVTWVKDAADLGLGNLQALAVDADGVVYLAAWDFENSVVAQVDADGNLLGSWPLTGLGVISDVAVNASGMVAISGSCLGMTADLNGTSITNPFMDYTLLLATFTTEGTLENHFVVHDVTCPRPSVELDDAGNAYFSADMSIPEDVGPFTVNGLEWVYGQYLVKMDTAGTITWLTTPTSGMTIGDAGRGSGRELVRSADGGVWQDGFTRGNVDWGNEVETNVELPATQLYFRSVDAEGQTQRMVVGEGNNFIQGVQGLATFGNDVLYMLGYTYDTLHLAGQEFPAQGYQVFLTRWQDISTGVSETPPTAQLTAFPNPAKDHLTLDLSAFTGVVDLEVLDAMGRTVLQPSRFNAGRHTVDVSALPQGAYVVRMQAGDRIANCHFVKE